MPLDPDKKIKSATERIEKMLAEYNATCKRHAGNLKSVNLQLKQLDALANSVVISMVAITTHLWPLIA